MTKSFRLLLTCLSLSLPSLTTAATLVWFDDFESGLEVYSRHGGNNIVAQVVSSPVLGDGHNQVLEYRDLPSSGSWGSELRYLGYTDGIIPLADFSATPGADTFKFEFDYFIPEDSVATGGDNLGVMIRFTSGLANGGDSTNKTKFYNVDNATKGQWIHFEYTDVIPEMDGVSNQPVAYIIPFIIWNDIGATNPEGVLGYVDNVQFYMTPEPGKTAFAMMGIATLLMRRQRRTATSSHL